MTDKEKEPEENSETAKILREIGEIYPTPAPTYLENCIWIRTAPTYIEEPITYKYKFYEPPHPMFPQFPPKEETKMDKEELEKIKKEFKEETDLFRVLERSGTGDLNEFVCARKDSLIELKRRSQEYSTLAYRVFDYFTNQEIDLDSVDVELTYKEK